MHIDIVLPWVDGNDPAWQQIKQSYQGTGDVREERYRDFGLLKYWFRSIETCMPWIHKVHLITMDQVPAWLKRDHPKLHLVDHRDYMPEDCLPTFNSNAIELNVHRIEELSEHFILFNDDLFVLKRIPETVFFRKGKPVDMLALQPVIANENNETMSYLYLNNSIVLARHFQKRETMKKYPWAYFHIGYPLMYFAYNNLERMWPHYTGFYTVHWPAPLRKSTLKKLWELEPEVLNTTTHNRYRDRTDVNQYLIREYEKQCGNFVPDNPHKYFQYFELGNDNRKLNQFIKRRTKPIICINDGNHPIDFEQTRRELNEAFEQLFPEKSTFEL